MSIQHVSIKVKYVLNVGDFLVILNEMENFAMVTLNRQDLDHIFIIAAENCAANVLLSFVMRQKRKAVGFVGWQNIQATTKTPEEVFALQYFFSSYHTMDESIYPIIAEWSDTVHKTILQYLITMKAYRNTVPQLEASYNNRMDAGDEWMHE